MCELVSWEHAGHIVRAREVRACELAMYEHAIYELARCEHTRNEDAMCGHERARWVSTREGASSRSIVTHSS